MATESDNQYPKTRQRSTKVEQDSVLGRILESTETVIYALVAGSFIVAGIVSLIYGVGKFGVAIIGLIEAGNATDAPQAIITFVSDLLLTIIIMEVLGTVVRYIRMHETNARPFLVIGIVSATRNILAVGAQVSISETTLTPTGNLTPVFTRWMIELGVNAGVIIALGITMLLVGRMGGAIISDGDPKPARHADTSEREAASVVADERTTPHER